MHNYCKVCGERINYTCLRHVHEMVELPPLCDQHSVAILKTIIAMAQTAGITSVETEIANAVREL